MDELRYIIYGINECPFCDRVLKFLEDSSREFVYFNLSEDMDFLREVKLFYNWSTVPIVLSNNKITGLTNLIGGCDDLCKP